MRVAVTGLDGFTGRYLDQILRERGHQVLPSVADVTDAQAIKAEMQQLRPDACIHLAAIAFTASKNVESYYHVNQIGTFNLLEGLSLAGNVKKVLLPSTAHVYGSTAAGIVGEDAPLDPPSHYALSKMAMELGTRFWSDQLEIIVTRPFNYTGIGQEERYLIPKIVSHFKRRDRVIELGNIDVRRDFGDVRSVASAYAGLIEANVRDSTINIASGSIHSVRELIDICSELTAHNIDIQVNPQFIRAGDVDILGGNISQLRSTLPDWKPIDIADTLRWMLGIE